MGYIIDVAAATDPDGLVLLLKKALEYTDGGKNSNQGGPTE